MVAFCLSFKQSPSEFYKLTHGEIAMFYEMNEPKTDLTGLF